MRVQRSAEHRVVPWANGLGVTADVCTWPSETTDWTWRLSIADVTDDVPFSSMPGVDRHITVASGSGMALTIDDAAEVRMDRTTAPLSFSGDGFTTCRLLDGPIADLNLMVRRGRATGRLTIARLTDRQQLVPDADTVAAVVLDGSVIVGGSSLAPFDVVLFEGEEAIAISATSATVVALAAVRVATWS